MINCDYLVMITLFGHNYSAVAHILTQSVSLFFEPESDIKNKCRARIGCGLVI